MVPSSPSSAARAAPGFPFAGATEGVTVACAGWNPLLDNNDEKSFLVAKDGRDGYIDYESAKSDSVDPARVEMFGKVPASKGGAMVVYGWTMAEDLVKLGSRT